MSHKEDESNKIPCPVCGKMISEKMGRAVHEKSKFHQDALKLQNGGEPVVKPPVEEPKPPVEDKPPVELEVKAPVTSGIAGKDKPKEPEKKSGGGIGKFLEGLFGEDEDDDW